MFMYLNKINLTIQMYFKGFRIKIRLSYIRYELLYYDPGKSRKTYNAALRFA